MTQVFFHRSNTKNSNIPLQPLLNSWRVNSISISKGQGQPLFVAKISLVALSQMPVSILPMPNVCVNETTLISPKIRHPIWSLRLPSPAPPSIRYPFR